VQLQMARTNVTLSDGSEVSIDINLISLREFREMTAPETEQERSDELMAKVVGMTAEALTGLGYVDYQRVMRKVIEVARDPLAADEKN